MPPRLGGGFEPLVGRISLQNGPRGDDPSDVG